MARRATQYPLLRQRRCVGHWSSFQLVAVVVGSFDQPSNSKNHATIIHSENVDAVSYGIALYFPKGQSLGITALWLRLATLLVLLTRMGHSYPGVSTWLDFT